MALFAILIAKRWVILTKLGLFHTKQHTHKLVVLCIYNLQTKPKSHNIEQIAAHHSDVIK